MSELKPQLTIRTSMTPDTIAGKLFSFHTIAHFYHLQTTSFAQHKMLDELYESLVGHKDAICEFLLGIQAPKRFSSIAASEIPVFTDQNLTKFIDEGCEFSKRLCTYGREVGYEELTNLASNLQGSFVKARYLNTLK